jgi:hypothetical protein
MTDHDSHLAALEQRLKSLEGEVHHLATAVKDGLEQFGHSLGEHAHNLHIVSGAKEAAESIATRLDPHHRHHHADSEADAPAEE